MHGQVSVCHARNALHDRVGAIAEPFWPPVGGIFLPKYQKAMNSHKNCIPLFVFVHPTRQCRCQFNISTFSQKRCAGGGGRWFKGCLEKTGFPYTAGRFECILCSKKFKLSQNLKAHARVHQYLAGSLAKVSGWQRFKTAGSSTPTSCNAISTTISLRKIVKSDLLYAG